MGFIDLKTHQKRIKEQLDANIQKVLAQGNYIMGPEVKELEQNLVSYVGAKHAISCASGTDALLMALMALGIGPGDAVFTTPFTLHRYGGGDQPSHAPYLEAVGKLVQNPKYGVHLDNKARINLDGYF